MIHGYLDDEKGDEEIKPQEFIVTVKNIKTGEASTYTEWGYTDNDVRNNGFMNGPDYEIIDIKPAAE